MNVLGFNFPDGLHYLVQEQVWAALDPDGVHATVGITSLGIHLAGGEIYMCRPKSIGSEIEQGRSVAVVELAKSVVSVRSPLSGTVVAINERLEETPELVHRDCYGEGWIARLRLTRIADERASLAQGSDVPEAMAKHAALHGLTERNAR